MKYCKHCQEELPLSHRGLQCKVCKNGLDRYNLDRLDQIKLFESQNGKCKLCEKNVYMFNGNRYNSGYIDHDHSNGKVRGILCHPCNSSLGYLEKYISLDKIKSYMVT
jgi:hypothetical protein